MDYQLRNIDPSLWKRFKIKCIENGTTLRAAILDLITKYLEEE
jgi:hypothetical protein